MNPKSAMTKAQPQYHLDIEFVRLSILPFQQYQRFVSWISPLSIFNLDVNGEILDDCVPYSDYDCWYELSMSESHFEANYSV